MTDIICINCDYSIVIDDEEAYDIEYSSCPMCGGLLSILEDEEEEEK